MKFEVTAIAINPQTNEIVADPRTEEINTLDNTIFRGCRTPWDIEDQYEAFWNRLNESWEYNFPQGKEKVKVISVTQVA